MHSAQKKVENYGKFTYQNAFLQLWYAKTKKTWQLLKNTTLVLKITLNS